MVTLSETDVIRRYIISGSRRFSNYWWGTIIFLGGSGFLLARGIQLFGKRSFSFNSIEKYPFFSARISHVFLWYFRCSF